VCSEHGVKNTAVHVSNTFIIILHFRKLCRPRVPGAAGSTCKFWVNPVNFTFQQPGASRSGTGGARAGASRCTRPGSERGVRLAQKMRVGPRIPVGIPLETADAGPTSRPTWRLSHLHRHRASAQALAVVGVVLHPDVRWLVMRIPRIRSHCRFRNRGTEYVSESGLKWMSGSTIKRQRDRALREPRLPVDLALGAGVKLHQAGHHLH
jgi:hypothetical protein